MQRTRQARDPASALEALGMGGARDRGDVKTGLVKLVLTVVEVVRQVLEKQAIRRVDAGDLTPAEVEKLGVAFIEIKGALLEISREFGIKPEEITDQLGALVKTGERGLDTVSLSELLDRLLDRGAVVAGSVKLSVSDIDLITLDLLAMIYPTYKSAPRRA